MYVLLTRIPPPRVVSIGAGMGILADMAADRAKCFGGGAVFELQVK